MLTSDKYSNLLGQFLSYEENEVLWIRPLDIRNDIQELKDLLSAMREETRKQMISLREETREQIDALKEDNRQQLESLREENNQQFINLQKEMHLFSPPPFFSPHLLSFLLLFLSLRPLLSLPLFSLCVSPLPFLSSYFLFSFFLSFLPYSFYLPFLRS